ncbi:Ionotropic receptor 268 [Blattella germanica]|nr:Ionotropic receptor 268 [Blattella germanica]
MLLLKLSFLLFYIFCSSLALLTLYRENSIEESLAKCIINISTKYFDKDKPVLVETPTNWFPHHYPYIEYGGKLIELLHKENQFSLIIYGIEAYLARLKVHIGSYIVLMPPVLRDIDNLYIEHMLGALFTWTYNCKGKVIVASLEQMASPEIRNLLNRAMNLELLHTILLKPRTLSQKHKDDHLDNIDIYNWFPNEQSNICSRTINKINHSDTWISQPNKFLFNTNLFPSDRKIDFKGCTLRVHFTHFPPHAIVNSELRESAGTIVSIFYSIMKYINCTMQYIPRPRADTSSEHIYFPIPLDPLDYDQNEIRDQLTYPHMVRDITWYVPQGKQQPRWTSLIRTFTSLVWFLLLLTFIFGSCTMWLLGKSERFGSNSTYKMNHGVLTDAMLTHLGVGVVYRYKGLIPSVFFMLWLYYCLIINTAYQSAFYGLLINPGHFPALQTSKQVEESTLHKVTSIFLNTASPFWSRFLKFRHCHDVELCFDSLADNQMLALLCTTWEGTSQYRILVLSTKKYVPINEIVGTIHLSIQVNQLRGILLDVFNKVLGRFADGGIIDQMTKEFNNIFLRKNPLIETAFSLTMDHLQVAFYLMLIGYVLSLSLNVIEFCVHFIINWFYLLCIKYQLQFAKLL